MASDPQAPAWLQRFRAKGHRPGLLLDEPPQGSLPPTHECGISLAWLQQFVTLAKKVGKPLDCTEAWIKAFVVPLARSPRAGRGRLYDYCPLEQRGLPHYYVVHTWSDSLDRVVEQVVKHTLATRPPVPAAAPTPRDDHGLPRAPSLNRGALDKMAATQRLLESTYVWIDICAINQHPCTSANAPTLNLDEIRASVAAAQLGSLVVMDPGFDVLTRCWCMYESWASVYYGDCQKLQVLFPEDLTLDELVVFQSQCTTMELVRGSTTKPADKQRIVAEVKHKVGVRRMQQLLPESLMRSARAGLRWSGTTNKLSMYCAMLLKNKEWYQVQTILHGIPELHDDEKMLQEIRDVFKMYDTDGSGELDQEEFVEVLGVAGFTDEESRNIFSLVDVDNGGSVCLEEFEQWWIESQRQQSTRHNAKCETTASALIVNLTAMVTMLERQNLKAHVPFYKSAISQLQQQMRASGSSDKPDINLIPAPVKGDWHTIAEQVAWKVNARDYRAASKLMYGLLLWNADTLKTDPASLGSPDNTQGLIPQLKLLCGFMDQFGTLMSSIPTNYRQSEYFHKAAAEVRNNILEPLLEREAELAGIPRSKSRRRKSVLLPGFEQYSISQIADDEKRPDQNRPAGSKGKGKKGKNGKKDGGAKPKKTRLFPGKFDMQREAVVSDMVKLKYGSQTLITASQLVEAEKSLSAWMAAQKSIHGQGMKQDDRAPWPTSPVPTSPQPAAYSAEARVLVR